MNLFLKMLILAFRLCYFSILDHCRSSVALINNIYEYDLFFLHSNSKGKKRAHPQPQIQRRAPVAKKPVLEDSDSDEENVSDESLDSD